MKFTKKQKEMLLRATFMNKKRVQGSKLELFKLHLKGVVRSPFFFGFLFGKTSMLTGKGGDEKMEIVKELANDCKGAIYDNDGNYCCPSCKKKGFSGMADYGIGGKEMVIYPATYDVKSSLDGTKILYKDLHICTHCENHYFVSEEIDKKEYQ